MLLLVGPRLGVSDAGAVSVVAIVGLLVSGSIALWGIVLVITRPPGRLMFQLVIAAPLLIAVQLALSRSQLVAG